MTTKSEEPAGLANILLFHGLRSPPREFGLITPGLRARRLPHEAVRVQGSTLASDANEFDWRRWRSVAADVVDARTQRDGPAILGGLCMGTIPTLSLPKGLTSICLSFAAPPGPAKDHTFLATSPENQDRRTDCRSLSRTLRARVLPA